MHIARRTEAAERDLQDIAFHIAFTHRRPLAAERSIDALIAQAEKIAQLSTTTVLGTAAPEIGDGVRLFRCKRWVVVFRYEQHGIDVLRFADGSQDYLSWKLR
ncbi:MAG: type II toxin-antitoxin system RelE/ParE family toxin [Planctomycetota bacterium]|nr:type II toxin-antitoxin system RelE/ParE family toxin [Planctomycetota bacterium]